MRNCEKDMQLVPFGKYKGQPVEVMQMDTGYCDWLSKQDWFREQYGNVYNQVIINNFTEPSETPEHNRLQMKFLDKSLCRRFEDFLEFNAFSLFENECMNTIRYLKMCAYRLMDQIPEARENKEQLENELSQIKERHNTVVLEMKKRESYDFSVSSVEFECKGWDVVYSAIYKTKLPLLDDCQKTFSVSRFIEIKPCLGDDFPAVLRQMKSNMRSISGKPEMVLVIDEFTATGATYEQVKQMFKLSDISLFRFSDFE